MTPERLGCEIGQHVVLRSKKVDRPSFLFAQRDQAPHEIDPGNALGKAEAQRSRRPHDALPVGVDEIAAGDDFANVRLVGHQYALPGVQDHVLSGPAGENQLAAAGDGLVHRQRIERDAEE
jgi:hypothetical protein